MHNIKFISTVHRENGKCNADELCNILEATKPEVIFLEALEDTYSRYQQYTFENFGVLHEKLEVRAIQKYSKVSNLKYVPVLDEGLSESFNEKYDLICSNVQWQRIIDDFNELVSEQGFQFLNSTKSIIYQEKMRDFEHHLLMDNKLSEDWIKDIEKYENSMIRNIYSYCKFNAFDSAIFLCGVAHRQSIIEKLGSSNKQEKMELNWEIYGD